MKTLKPGTQIELYGAPAFGVAPEQAKIARWTKISGPRETMPNWHIVKFNDGGRRFRVIDNRP